MAGLTINGITVPVLVRDAKLSWDITQDSTKADDGTPRKTIRARKRKWELKLKNQSQSTVDAFRNLINGEGHAWSFDTDVYSSKGLAANAGHTTTIVASGKYGSKARVPNATTIVWAAALGSNWTVAVWRLETATWHHYVVKSNGHKWVDGVRTDGATTTFISVSSGSLTITGATGNTDFDDLQAMPYLVETDWPPMMYTENNTRACALNELLSANGDLVKSGPVSVVGEAGASSIIPFASNKNGEQMDFILSEY